MHGYVYVCKYVCRYICMCAQLTLEFCLIFPCSFNLNLFLASLQLCSRALGCLLASFLGASAPARSHAENCLPGRDMSQGVY